MSTNCLEASAEVVRSNRDTSAKSWHITRVTGEGKGGGAASIGPVVEHVAFSSDGKVIIVSIYIGTIRYIIHGNCFDILYTEISFFSIYLISELFRSMTYRKYFNIRLIESVDMLFM